MSRKKCGPIELWRIANLGSAVFTASFRHWRHWKNIFKISLVVGGVAWLNGWRVSSRYWASIFRIGCRWRWLLSYCRWPSCGGKARSTLANDAHRTYRTLPVNRSHPLCQFKFSGPKKGRGRIGDPTPFSPRTAIGAYTGSSHSRLFSYCTASNRKKILCRNH